MRPPINGSLNPHTPIQALALHALLRYPAPQDRTLRTGRSGEMEAGMTNARVRSRSASRFTAGAARCADRWTSEPWRINGDNSKRHSE
jgi:hypothetical protein